MDRIHGLLNKTLRLIVPVVWISLIVQTLAYFFTDSVPFVRPMITLLGLVVFHYLIGDPKMWWLPYWVTKANKVFNIKEPYLTYYEYVAPYFVIGENLIGFTTRVPTLFQEYGLSIYIVTAYYFLWFLAYLVYAAYAVTICCQYNPGRFSRTEGKFYQIVQILYSVSWPWLGLLVEIGTHQQLANFLATLFLNLWITLWQFIINAAVGTYSDDSIFTTTTIILGLALYPRAIDTSLHIMYYFLEEVNRHFLSIARIMADV